MERRVGGSASPLEIYTYARSTGQLTGKMLHFAVKPLLTAHGLLKPSVRVIDKALELYRDFVSGLEPLREPSPYPIPGTYQLFLRALTAVDNIPKYLPIAASLLEDMRKFRLHLDPQTASSFLILLMNTSRTPEEALSMYRLIARPDDPSKWVYFNEEAYVATLDAFCKLPTWPDGIPSVQLYFGIIADMRKRGLPLGPKVYTIILGQMARLATAATEVDNSSARAAIAQAIAAVHNHLTVNPSFTPDTALWNQLMDAYQRAGCFPEAFRIWQTLFASGTFNAASVSVVLDACAFARAYDSAVRVYGALSAVGFPMNVKNWNTYLECLCRLGRLDEAMKVLCLEMTGREDVEPDKESARILLKFAINANREGEVRTRLRRFLPKLYYSLNSEK
ncbi:hypothetical protein C8Q77DRAFT_1214105 [Trametes polyzona]|nr:hypothetical protein C8Q77DRAFT_1214105 [Trametes polyzona]